MSSVASRARWPAVEIVVRGDSHYGRPEAMTWCERQHIGYIFAPCVPAIQCCCAGLSPLAEDAALGRLARKAEKVRRYSDFRYAAKSWNVERRVIRPTSRPVRKVPTAGLSSPICQACPRHCYDKVYCARGQATGNLIKAHKLHRCASRPHFLPQRPLHPTSFG